MRNRARAAWSEAGATGGRGERLAEDFLRDRGFRVLERNWRNPGDRRGEIDLICSDAGILVFVEVKTRAARALVPGYFAVGRRKRLALRRAAEAYLRGLPAPPRTFRLDVVEVSIPGGQPPGPAPEILHFENIPLFSKYFRGVR